MSRTLILASTSPYRRELLARLAIPFIVTDPGTDETPTAQESPEDTALRLAAAKARAVAEGHPGSLVIGSDQVAFANGRLYGKPGDHERARAQLRQLSGNTVNFFTAICLLDADSGRSQLRGVSTLVTFRALDDAEIERYLRLERPYNCAGSAKSEGLGISLLAALQGTDPTALIGLPLIALCDMLRAEGIAIP